MTADHERTQMPEHQYFRETRGRTPNARCRAVAAYILNRYLSKDLSVTKWREMKPTQGHWGDPGERRSARVDFGAMVAQLHQHGRLSLDVFGFPPLFSPLFDFPAEIGLPQTFVDPDGKPLVMRIQTTLGEKFPLIPTLDREGFAIPDMQNLVERNVARLFRKLVATSHSATQPRSEWLNDFRLFVVDCVAAIDMMLHKIHLLAEYRSQELGWHFDREAMGQRHGVRLMDKFKWIGLASGRQFALTPRTHTAFKRLKALRNHVAHFDPPCFAATMQEACDWLNYVQDVADVLWSIRRHFSQQLGEATVELLLLPRLEYQCNSLFDRPIAPAGERVGHRSTSWPDPDAA